MSSLASRPLWKERLRIRELYDRRTFFVLTSIAYLLPLWPFLRLECFMGLAGASSILPQ
jgi:hypothetical protein